MKISDLDKLNLYLPKIVDGTEGFSFKDYTEMNSVFISDNIPKGEMLIGRKLFTLLRNIISHRKILFKS